MYNTIDHTLLKPWVTEDHIRLLCEEAQEYNFRGVCVTPKWIRLAKEKCKLVSAVVDFPLGCSLSKFTQAKDAVDTGADEIDVVWDLSSFLDEKYLKVTQELGWIVKLGIPVKVIVESCFLSALQQSVAYQIVKDSGAWCIKTSTGFFGGATLETIHLWKNMGGLKIKASGGIKTRLHASILLNAGADILGTSAGVQILKEQAEERLVTGLENFAAEIEKE